MSKELQNIMNVIRWNFSLTSRQELIMTLVTEKKLDALHWAFKTFEADIYLLDNLT